MAADSQDRHRPGAFKQQNKGHKTGRHRSKGQLAKEQQGRVNVKVLTKHAKKTMGKNARRNQAMQIRKQQREEVIAKKRNRGGQGSAPFLCAIVCLSEGLDAAAVLDLVRQCDDSATVVTNDLGTLHISLPRFKQRFSFICPTYGDLYAMLDAAKVADSLLFLLSPDGGVDEYGDYCLTCLFAQGLPASVLALQGMKNLPQKRQSEAKKSVQKALENRFPGEKLQTMDSTQDALLLLRTVGSQKQRAITIRENRPHMIAEDVSFELNDEQSTNGTLKVSGYIRGQALSVNGLVHLPGWGDFQMSQIDAPNDPYLPAQRQTKSQEVEMSEEEARVLEKANAAKQESLQAENDLDPMEGEQTWPTEEELEEAEAKSKAKKEVRKVPKGTSEYQAAWIMEDEEAGANDEQGSDDDDDDDEDDDDDDMDMEDDDSEGSEDDDSEQEEEEHKEEMESLTVTWGDDVKYDADFNMEEEMSLLNKYKESRQHEMFPDEVDTPQDVAARTRFQRYRGLKSFRTSEWDPQENLPQDYARIFQFANFKQTKKRVFAGLAEREGAEPGWYVTIHIKDVPRELMESYKPGSPIILFGLLAHEQKMSVCNFMLKRFHGNDRPIKSKERMIFHVGFRRFAAGPVYSQHTNGDKHKFERFFRPGSTVIGTVFCPIMFPPASVLMFKEKMNGDHELVATGSLLSVNPERIVSKRIVISGHPFKINRKTAVIRYMFFNREDIDWFKPVELHTKWGRRGHIKVPLGTHGHMKCTFDGQLKSQDTVMMNLYKRIFPKWTYEAVVKQPAVGSEAPDGKMNTQLMEEMFD